jgi:uncharacterized protein (UPF0212 family)
MHARFGSRVIRLPELSALPVYRRDIDDAAEVSVYHTLDDMARAVEYRVEVGADYRMPVFGFHIDQTAIAGNAGIVHERIDVAVFAFNLFDHVAGAFEVAHIAMKQLDVNAFMIHLLCPFFGFFLCMEISHYPETFAMKLFTHGSAQAAGSSCNQYRTLVV